jgi:hypothetical protein
MLKGFRDFILRGNVLDLAVAVVIGAAFWVNRDLAGQGPHHSVDRGDCKETGLSRTLCFTSTAPTSPTAIS